jgi:hypothetical protein
MKFSDTSEPLEVLEDTDCLRDLWVKFCHEAGGTNQERGQARLRLATAFSLVVSAIALNSCRITTDGNSLIIAQAI